VIWTIRQKNGLDQTFSLRDIFGVRGAARRELGAISALY
jgi:hypothetical protein